MNDARLGTFAASHLAGYQAHAAGAAMAGTTVIGQVDAVVQRRIQQHLAAARQKAIAIDRNVMTSCHSLIRKAKVPHLRLVRVTRRRLHFLEGSANQAYQAKKGKQSGESVLPAPCDPAPAMQNAGTPNLEISKISTARRDSAAAD